MISTLWGINCRRWEELNKLITNGNSVGEAETVIARIDHYEHLIIRLLQGRFYRLEDGRILVERNNKLVILSESLA